MAGMNTEDDETDVMPKRAKSSTWIVSNENEVEMGVDDGVPYDQLSNSPNAQQQQNDCAASSNSKRFDFLDAGCDSDEANDSPDDTLASYIINDKSMDNGNGIVNDSLKTVRFSVNMSNRTVGNSQRSMASLQKAGSNNSMRSPVSKEKRKTIFTSPPPSTFPTPPRLLQYSAEKSFNYARETSSALARSGKHFFRQIGLAGKDAYQVLGASDTRTANPSNAANGGQINPIQRSSPADSDGIRSEEEAYNDNDGTVLHYACASNDFVRIQTALQRRGAEDVHQVDSQGKYPLHVLSENVKLISEFPLECEEIALDIVQLMGPENAVQALHPSSGWAPFIYIIGQWVEKLHQNAAPRLLNSVIPSAASRSLTAPMTSDPDEEDQSGAACPLPPAVLFSSKSSQTKPRRLSYFPLFGATSAENDRSLVSSTFISDREKALFLPEAATISDHVIWAIRILSRLIDEYPEQTREAILTNITSTVPLFLKSVFLIHDADEMQPLIDTTLVKHTIVDKRSINVWLIAMLTSRREIKGRAVTFLRLLSRLTLMDLAATSHYPDRYSDKEIERFIRLRKETFNAVYVMPGIFPAVLALGGQAIENLSTTRVMRYITDRTIRKERVFFRLICDFFYSVFLLMGYRLHVEFVLAFKNFDGPIDYREHRYLSVSTSCIACYFLFKEGMTLLSLYLTSTQLAKRYLTSVFNVIDFASVMMLLGTGGALMDDPDLNDGWAASLTIILLWLKLLGAFKILNSSFSLFLYAVNEVLKDIKWFLFFLFAVTFMFSDAARAVVSARGDCDTEDGADFITDEFCSDDFLAINTRMYAVLVGDVSLDYFQSSDAMVVVFVFFSFFCIIVLLNILVAVIIDSFNGSKERSREIFERGRLEYAARLVARKQFLTPKEYSDFHVASYVPQQLRRFLRLCYVVVYAIALMAIEYGFFGAIKYLQVDVVEADKMVHSLILMYICVCAVFNGYISTFAIIALYSRYEYRLNPNGSILMKRFIWMLELGVKLFHRLLGFSSDKALDLSEELLEIHG
jgi:hypothetical protein